MAAASDAGGGEGGAEDVAAVASTGDAAVDHQLAHDIARVIMTVGDVFGRQSGPDPLAAEALAQRSGRAVSDVPASGLGGGVLAGGRGDAGVFGQWRQRGLAAQFGDGLVKGVGILAMGRPAGQFVGVSPRIAPDVVDLVEDRLLQGLGERGGG